MCVWRQSINQRSSQSHTRAKENPHPSTTTRGANSASRSDAGLGGCERVATALVCETRLWSICAAAATPAPRPERRAPRKREVRQPDDTRGAENAEHEESDATQCHYNVNVITLTLGVRVVHDA